jgi:uncharacterized repeat protein (TIGR03806 family)
MFAAIFQPNFVLLGFEFLFLFHLQQRMKISFVQRIIAFGLALFLISCNQEENYVPIVESPVSVDLTQVPYPNLSEYKFFDGPLKELKPAVGLLLYKPASELFTDYASKSRYVWMPKGTKATFISEHAVLELPVGAVLIKNFFYDRVQPTNTKRIIETRIMIRKQSGWIFAEYVWNEEQTEAVLNLAGSSLPITWIDDQNVTRTITYKIPKESECLACHNIAQTVVPIGIKPQNLNFNFTYPNSTTMQLTKWVESGYLETNFPAVTQSTINYQDQSKPIGLRMRSFVDMNCAHCHRDGGYATVFALRFEFYKTTLLSNMGVCVSPNHFMPGFSGELVTPGDINRSILYARVSTNDPNYRMPFLGRSIVHQEAVDLVTQWINSLEGCE